jgi:hypothetical protein
MRAQTTCADEPKVQGICLNLHSPDDALREGREPRPLSAFRSPIEKPVADAFVHGRSKAAFCEIDAVVVVRCGLQKAKVTSLKLVERVIISTT